MRLIIFLAALTASLPAQPVIEGAIDSAKALKFLYGNYDPEVKGSTTKDPRVLELLRDEGFVQELASQEGLADGKPQWFLYTIVSPANNPDYSCHGCELVIGAAMFEKNERGWVNKAHAPAMNGVGSFGKVPMDFKVVQWGKQAYGLILSDGYSDHGRDSGFDVLYACKPGSCGHIFGLPTGFSNDLAEDPKPNISWQVKWSFGPPGPTGMFDVVVKRGETNPAKIAAARKASYPIPTAGVFRYDGKVYRLPGTQIELGK